MIHTPVEKRFVVAVLCPDATFSHLLQEAQRYNLTILEMIPFRPGATDLTAQIRAGRTVLFIYGNGKSLLAHTEAQVYEGLSSCHELTAP